MLYIEFKTKTVIETYTANVRQNDVGLKGSAYWPIFIVPRTFY